MGTPTIYITENDRLRIHGLIASSRIGPKGNARYLDALEGELRRARVVRPSEVPRDVVTMHSTVRLRDLDAAESETYTLVYPSQADPENHCISVLAPVGTAILGYRVGDVVEWPVPAGTRRLRVEEVLYQPEREGVYDQ
jgi:regulator of nucleoside diphosphate kinase